MLTYTASNQYYTRLSGTKNMFHTPNQGRCPRNKFNPHLDWNLQLQRSRHNSSHHIHISLPSASTDLLRHHIINPLHIHCPEGHFHTRVVSENANVGHAV